jgi:hypothetical protein
MSLGAGAEITNYASGSFIFTTDLKKSYSKKPTVGSLLSFESAVYFPQSAVYFPSVGSLLSSVGSLLSSE